MSTTSLMPYTFSGKERSRVSWHLARAKKHLPIWVGWVGCGITLGYEIEELHEYCEKTQKDTGDVLNEMKEEIYSRIYK